MAATCSCVTAPMRPQCRADGRRARAGPGDDRGQGWMKRGHGVAYDALALCAQEKLNQDADRSPMCPRFEKLNRGRGAGGWVA